MKKFLSLLLLVVAGFTTASAQFTVVYDHDLDPSTKVQPVNDGDVLTFYAEDDGFGGIGIERNDPNILTSEAGTLTVKVDVPSRFSWCMGEECQMLKAGQHQKELKATDSSFFMLALHMTFVEGQFEKRMVPVEVSMNGKTMTFYIEYVYSENTGITNTTVENNLKMSGNVLAYQFGRAAARNLSVYSLDGKMVLNQNLSKMSGSVSLSHLQRGVYLYSLKENGKQVKVRKVVIK